MTSCCCRSHRLFDQRDGLALLVLALADHLDDLRLLREGFVCLRIMLNWYFKLRQDGDKTAMIRTGTVRIMQRLGIGTGNQDGEDYATKWHRDGIKT